MWLLLVLPLLTFFAHTTFIIAATGSSSSSSSSSLPRGTVKSSVIPGYVPNGILSTRKRIRHYHFSSFPPPPPPRLHRALSTAIKSQGTDADNNSNKKTKSSNNNACQHTLAILSAPKTSSDRIANEAILETALRRTAPTGKLSVVLRSNTDLNGIQPTLAELRGYVGEIYSMLWDCALGTDETMNDDKDEKAKPSSTSSSSSSSLSIGKGFANTGNLLDVIVYPQNLPNAAPEAWIYHRPTLQCIVSHDTIVGWVSESASGTGISYSTANGDGLGGLDAHVKAVNNDRRARGLPDVHAHYVEPWPAGATTTTAITTGAGSTDDGNEVIFLEDDDAMERQIRQLIQQQQQEQLLLNEYDVVTNVEHAGGLIGGTRVPSKSLFQSVAVGGTFDGMHYGHRKLLTLAVSSVYPGTGRLLVGVTIDEMLQHKAYAEYIPTLTERMYGVKQFLNDLAPGMKNRIKVVPIRDAYGPPGMSPTEHELGFDFDALVLSHETLRTGQQLNEHRVKDLGLKPLALLCTRRTEPHGMSSTALRRMRALNSSRRNKKKEGAPY